MNIRCPDTTKCNECSCGRTPEDRKANVLSLDQLSAGGFEEAEEDIGGLLNLPVWSLKKSYYALQQAKGCREEG